MNKVAALVLVVVVGTALAMPSDSYHPHPRYRQDPIPYSFRYGVNNELTGTRFSQQEDSDGRRVWGYYDVDLPDGRIQTVKYTADDNNGYQAEVTYQGEAQYPHEHGPSSVVRPSYGSAPSYTPLAASFTPSARGPSYGH